MEEYPNYADPARHPKSGILLEDLGYTHPSNSGGDGCGISALAGIVFIICFVIAAFQYIWENVNGSSANSTQSLKKAGMYDKAVMHESLAKGLKSNQVMALGAANDLQGAWQIRLLFVQKGFEDAKIFYCDCRKEARFRVITELKDLKGHLGEQMFFTKSGIADTFQQIPIYKVQYLGNR